MSKKSMQEYLKKYLSPSEGGVKEKKKKKKKKANIAKINNIKIIDEDADWGHNSDEDDIINNKLLPQDEKPQVYEKEKKKDPYEDRNLWKKFGEDDNSPAPRKRLDSNSDDNSPVRRNRHDSDSEGDKSPPRRKRHDSDSDGDKSPPRRKRHDSNSDSDRSPPRIKRQDSDSDRDNSPPRRKRQDSSDDNSPPRRKKRRHDSNSDVSPPRRNGKRQNSSDGDSDMDVRRGNQGGDSDSDLDVAKRPSNSNHGDDSDGSDLDDVRTKKSTVSKMDDGRSAGLVTAAQNRKEKPKGRKMSNLQHLAEQFKNTKTTRREKGTGKVRDTTEEDRIKKEKEEKRKKKEEKYSRWGKGLKNTERRNADIAALVHEESKPLARYNDDADLDKMRKEQIFEEEDPMAAYIMKKKKKASGVKEYPQYQGPSPHPNRFNIKPGYRWDGVDRSNGFEGRFFRMEQDRSTAKRHYYQWSVSEM